MKSKPFGRQFAPSRVLPTDSSGRVADLLRRVLRKDHILDKTKLTCWQMILLQSKANGCLYGGDDLPEIKWSWPKKTWLQERLMKYPDGTSAQQSRDADLRPRKRVQ